jgi:hypothetical protein
MVVCRSRVVTPSFASAGLTASMLVRDINPRRVKQSGEIGDLDQDAAPAVRVGAGHAREWQAPVVE